jgi:hypothetical protein
MRQSMAWKFVKFDAPMNSPAMLADLTQINFAGGFYAKV